MLAATLVSAGCNGNSPLSLGPKSVTHTVPADTEVELITLQAVSSDGSDVGDKLTFVVGSDIKSTDGNVAIPEGTKVQAVISKSRGANALSGLINQPARISVELNPIEVSEGQTIVLSGNVDDNPSEYAFKREDGLPSGDPQVLKDMMQDAATQQLFKDLGDAIERGENPQDLASRLSENPAFKMMLEQERMKYSKRFSNSKADAEAGVQDLLKSFSEIKKGNLAAVSDMDVSLILSAVGEMGSMVEDAQDTLKGVMKGRNIRIPIGSRIKVKTAQSSTWTVKL